MNFQVEVSESGPDAVGWWHKRFESPGLTEAMQAAARWIGEPQTAEGEMVVAVRVTVGVPAMVDVAYTKGHLQ